MKLSLRYTAILHPGGWGGVKDFGRFFRVMRVLDFYDLAAKDTKCAKEKRIPHFVRNDNPIRLWTPALLVAEGFNGVQARGSEGWDHAAEQADNCEDDRGDY